MVLAMIFFSTTVLLPNPSQAQTLLNLPQPGTLIQTTQATMPIIMKGINIKPDQPLHFNFIIDNGDTGLDINSAAFKNESQKLINYFLAALTIKEEDLWVNLSPYEADRMIPEALGETRMGRDMLAQDYLLKQLASSLLHPDYEYGKAFWKRVYTQAQEKYGTTNIPTETFNKVWVVADKARVLERNNTAYVVESHLKVMMDRDYLALSHQQSVISTASEKRQLEADHLSNAVMREIIIPAIEEEVNHGEHFAPLRQMYHAMILASWYKIAVKNAILNKVYSNSDKTSGVLSDNPEDNQHIYDQYVQAYRQGAFDLIKEDYDAVQDTVVPRHYFSGGKKINLQLGDNLFIAHDRTLNDAPLRRGDLAMVSTEIAALSRLEKAANAYKEDAALEPQILQAHVLLEKDESQTVAELVNKPRGNALIPKDGAMLIDMDTIELESIDNYSTTTMFKFNNHYTILAMHVPMEKKTYFVISQSSFTLHQMEINDSELYIENWKELVRLVNVSYAQRMRSFQSYRAAATNTDIVVTNQDMNGSVEVPIQLVQDQLMQDEGANAENQKPSWVNFTVKSQPDGVQAAVVFDTPSVSPEQLFKGYRAFWSAVRRNLPKITNSLKRRFKKEYAGNNLRRKFTPPSKGNHMGRDMIWHINITRKGISIADTLISFGEFELFYSSNGNTWEFNFSNGSLKINTKEHEFGFGAVKAIAFNDLGGIDVYLDSQSYEKAFPNSPEDNISLEVLTLKKWNAVAEEAFAAMPEDGAMIVDPEQSAAQPAVVMPKSLDDLEENPVNINLYDSVFYYFFKTGYRLVIDHTNMKSSYAILFQHEIKLHQVQLPAFDDVLERYSWKKWLQLLIDDYNENPVAQPVTNTVAQPVTNTDEVVANRDVNDGVQTTIATEMRRLRSGNTIQFNPAQSKFLGSLLHFQTKKRGQQHRIFLRVNEKGTLVVTEEKTDPAANEKTHAFGDTIKNTVSTPIEKGATYPIAYMGMAATLHWDGTEVRINKLTIPRENAEIYFKQSAFVLSPGVNLPGSRLLLGDGENLQEVSLEKVLNERNQIGDPATTKVVLPQHEVNLVPGAHNNRLDLNDFTMHYVVINGYRKEGATNAASQLAVHLVASEAQSDDAMRSAGDSLNITPALAETRGGIDLDAANLGLDIDRIDGGVDVFTDEAMMATFNHGDFSGVRGFILRIVPLASPLPLLGYDDMDTQEGIV